MYTIAINGFGRIGRITARVLLDRRRIDRVVAVNDIADTETLAYLLKHDTNYGVLDERIEAVPAPNKYATGGIRIGHHVISILSEKDPAKLPWRELQVDLVVEATGRFTESEEAKKHISAGAKQVIVSAPGKGDPPAPTSIIGVNAGRNDREVINNASCTTNCIAPMMAVLEAAFGVEQALMTTIHSLTAEQSLVDGPTPPLHRDLRRGRSAGQNIIPTTTGAAVATTEAVTTLRNKFDGVALRIPTPVGSLSDVTALLVKSATVDEVNNSFRLAAENPLYAGVIAVSNEPLVSSDIRGRSESVIVDLALTRVQGNLVKVFGWYDNEWGYAHRIVDQILRLSGEVS